MSCTKKCLIPLFIILYLVLSLSLLANVEHSALIVMADPANPSSSEAAILSLLTEGRFERTQSSSAEGLAAEHWAQYQLIVAVEDGALSSQQVSSIIGSGASLLLLKASIGAAGGTMQSGNNHNSRQMIIDEDQGFLEGFKSTLSFEVQSEDAGYYIRDAYPAGWTILARNPANQSNKVALFRENLRSGSKAIAWGFDPAKLTGAGRNVLKLALDWLVTPTNEKQTMIPEGNALFVIKGFEAGADLDLSPAENAHYNLLMTLGYDVSFVAFSHLKNTDLSSAALITAADYPSLDAVSFARLLSAGKKIWLQYSAGAVLGGDWRSSDNINSRMAEIQDNLGFMQGYKSTVAFQVQNRYDVHHVSSPYPAGWSSLAAHSGNPNQKTMFIREDRSGAKALICGYNPQELTDQGKSMMEKIFTWFEGVAPVRGVTVPRGDIAFVISGHKDGSSPTMTEAENALYSLFLQKGLSVTPIRWSRLAASDLSAASLVVAAEYPALSSTDVEALIGAGIPVLLAYNAGSALGGEWRSGSSSVHRRITALGVGEALNSFTRAADSSVQDSGAVFTVQGELPRGWQALAYADNRSRYTMLSLVEGKALIFGYNPSGLNDIGKELLDFGLVWLAK